VVIAGGGFVAARKTEALLAAGALVTVVAPEPAPELRDAANAGTLRLIERPFEDGDVEGATLVFAATRDAGVNATVVAAARARRILVDDASGAGPRDFVTAMAHRVGPLTFTVDTGGLSPAFAVRLKRELAERYDERYARAARALGFAREYVKAVVDEQERGALMRELSERDIDELAAMNPSTIENEVDEAYKRVKRSASAAADAPFVQLVCATRASALAMWQTRHVMSAIAKRGLVSTVLQISTKGDRVLDRSLADIGTDSLFVKELENALRDRRADYAVHSCKDLPSTLPADMHLAAIGPRADARDAFCSERYASIDALPPGAVIGTSSPRRRAQLEALRPDLRFETIRGNVETRLRKLREGEFDAILLAMAGLVRLGVGATYTVPVETDVIVPAVGQGALAIEVRNADQALAARIHEAFADRATELAVTAERAFLRTLQGGCQAPVGAHATFDGDTLMLRAAMAGALEGRILRGTASGHVNAAHEAEDLGTSLARRLLKERDAEENGVAEPLAGKVFLLPRTQERPSHIAPALRSAGADVIEAHDSDAALALLGGRTPHALLFPSSGSVRAVDAYLAALRRGVRRPIVAAMGEASAAAASEAGFPPDVVANEPSAGAFVQTITSYVMSKEDL
jgi:hydroxymethylbilane synthase